MHDREITETPINQFICWCLNDTSVHCFIFTIENADGARPKHHTGKIISEDNSQCLSALWYEVINDGYQYSLLADSR